MKKSTVIEIDNLWFEIETEPWLVEIENIKTRNSCVRILKNILPFILMMVVAPLETFADENPGFKVYRNSKPVQIFLDAPRIPEPNNIPVNNSGINFVGVALLLLNLLNGYQGSKQTAVIQRSMELSHITTLENKKLLKSLILSGGRLVLAASVSFYAISILILIRLTRKEEFNSKLKHFKDQQFRLFILQLAVIAGSILWKDIQSFPTSLKKVQMKKNFVKIIAVIADLPLQEFIFIMASLGGLRVLFDRVIFPLLFKKYPELSFMLDYYNLKLDETEVMASLAKLEKRTKILNIIAKRDKTRMTVRSTYEILEKTYLDKLFLGYRIDVMRILGRNLPQRPYNENYKPSYFYRLHQSYRIKQNLLAIGYFVVYLQMFERLPFFQDLIFNSVKNEIPDETDYTEI